MIFDVFEESFEQKKSNESVLKLLRKIHKGEVRIPHFQREQCWNVKQASALMDSVLKGITIGDVISWQTENRMPKDRFVFGEPDVSKLSNIQYLLDGQQRLTSFYGVYQGVTINGNHFGKVSVDVTANPNTNLTTPVCFVKKYNKDTHLVPIHELLSLRTKDDVQEYIIENYGDEPTSTTNGYFLNLLDYKSILESVKIGFMEIETNSQKVAGYIFQRINNTSKPMTDVDIAGAFMFDIESEWYFHDKTQQVIDISASEGFSTNKILQLRMLSLLYLNTYSPREFSRLDVKMIANDWEYFLSSLSRARDYLKLTLKIDSDKNLVAKAHIFPLVVYFFWKKGSNPTNEESKKLQKLFFSRVLNNYYDSNSTSRVPMDTRIINEILEGGEPDDLIFINYDTEENKKSIVLSANGWTQQSKLYYSVLCKQNPISLVTGNPVLGNSTSSWANKVNLHHIFPKSTHGKNSNNIFNYMLLDAESNVHIGNNHPSEYFTIERFENDLEFRRMLESHFIGWDEIKDIERNDLESFKRHRMVKMVEWLKVNYFK